HCSLHSCPPRRSSDLHCRTQRPAPIRSCGLLPLPRTAPSHRGRRRGQPPHAGPPPTVRVRAELGVRLAAHRLACPAAPALPFLPLGAVPARPDPSTGH